MSLKMTNLVWNLDPDVVTVHERIILLCLADFANRQGREAWPAWSTIAERTSLTRQTVWRCLTRLKTIGLLVPSGRTRRGTVVYSLNIDQIAELGRTSNTVLLPASDQYQRVTPPVTERDPPSNRVLRHQYQAVTRSGIEPVLNRKGTVAAFAAKSSPPFSDQAEKAEKTEAEISAERLENMARLAVFLKTAVKSMP